MNLLDTPCPKCGRDQMVLQAETREEELDLLIRCPGPNFQSNFPTTCRFLEIDCDGCDYVSNASIDFDQFDEIEGAS